MNFVSIVSCWLKHADDIGYTIIDLIAPMFIFTMGVRYDLSFYKHLEQDGAWKTYQHFIARNLAWVGLGYPITLIWEISGIRPPAINQGLFQALGAAGLVTLAVIQRPILWRIAAGLGLIAGYQILLDRFRLQDVMVAPHNGPWGVLCWSAI